MMTETIIDYILKELIGEDEPLQADDDLLNSGLVDSIGIMRLIGFIESKYDMKVPPQDMVIENFISVEAIVQYIEQVKK